MSKQTERAKKLLDQNDFLGELYASDNPLIMEVEETILQDPEHKAVLREIIETQEGWKKLADDGASAKDTLVYMDELNTLYTRLERLFEVAAYKFGLRQGIETMLLVQNPRVAPLEGRFIGDSQAMRVLWDYYSECGNQKLIKTERYKKHAQQREKILEKIADSFGEETRRETEIVMSDSADVYLEDAFITAFMWGIEVGRL